MRMRLRGTEGECRHKAETTGGNCRNRFSPGRHDCPGSCGRDLAWRPTTTADPAGKSRAGPAAQSVRRRTHEPERSPLANGKAKS
jgi:hypothetical protein